MTKFPSSMDSRLQMMATLVFVGTIMSIPLAMVMALKRQDEESKQER